MYSIMAIIETAIMFNGTNLVEDQYYSSANVLDKRIRNGLLQTIKNLTSEAFGEDVQSFTLGDYSIIMASRDIEDSKHEKIKKDLDSLMIYCIIDKKTDEKAVLRALDEAISLFLNRYSFFDIQEMRIRKFRKFRPRLKEIYGDLTLMSEDRFKSLF